MSTHKNLRVAHVRGLLVSRGLSGLEASHGLFLFLNETAARAAACTDEIHKNIAFDTEAFAHLATFDPLENPCASTVEQAKPTAALPERRLVLALPVSRVRLERKRIEKNVHCHCSS